MVAKHKSCGGRCGTNASWFWVSVVGADKVHIEG